MKGFSWKRAYLRHLADCKSCELSEIKTAFFAAGMLKDVLDDGSGVPHSVGT